MNMYQIINGPDLSVDQYVAIRPLFGGVDQHPDGRWFWERAFYFSPKGKFMGIYRDIRRAS